MRSYLNRMVIWTYTASSLWSWFLESSHGGARFTQGSQMPPYSWKCSSQSPLCSWKWHQVILRRRACCCSWKRHQKIPVRFIDLKSLSLSLLFLKRHQKPPQKYCTPNSLYSNNMATNCALDLWHYTFGKLIRKDEDQFYDRQCVYRTYWVLF